VLLARAIAKGSIRIARLFFRPGDAISKGHPADKYAWTPQSGVRSFAGVFAHIISANYFLCFKIGSYDSPNGENGNHRKDLTTKDQIAASLKQSYDLMIGAIKNVKDADLTKKVEFLSQASTLI